MLHGGPFPLSTDLFIHHFFFLPPLSLQLGAICFDHDLRAITTYLSSQTTFGAVRDKFVQLQQISMLLNLNHVRPFFNSFFFVRCDSYVGYTRIELPIF